jgi:hypothetical protein
MQAVAQKIATLGKALPGNRAIAWIPGKFMP